MAHILHLLLPLLIVLTSQHQIQAKQQSTTKLSVYYETLCGDSKRFITRQLYPLMRSPIGKYVDLTLVPYGKARTTESNDGEITFSCQHGRRECNGNREHACALAKLTSAQALRFIHCSMASSDPPEAGPDCSEKNDIEYSTIKSCVDSGEGDKLLAANGRQTHSLSPTLYFVPWIVFDGEWSQGKMDGSLRDLRGEVCSIVGEDKCSAQEDNRGSRRTKRRTIYSLNKIRGPRL